MRRECFVASIPGRRVLQSLLLNFALAGRFCAMDNTSKVLLSGRGKLYRFYVLALNSVGVCPVCALNMRVKWLTLLNPRRSEM